MSRENEPDFSDAQDEIRWLRDALTVERKRRQEMEDLWYQEQRAHTAAVTRAEQAERDVSVWKIATGASIPEHAQQALHNLRGDLQQAERERDEARSALAHAVTVAAETHSLLQRAEAATAVLLKALDRAKIGLSRVLRFGTGPSEEAHPEVNTFGEEVALIDAALFGIHPGAALLERMRAAEALRPLAMHDSACRHEGDSAPRWAGLDPERCAACAFDALKAPHE